MKLLMTQFSPAPVTTYPVRSGFSPEHPNHKQLRARDQVSHPYRRACKLVYFSVKRTGTTSPRLITYAK
jgi:hypothetical protein